MLYMEKRLAPKVDDFGAILLVHAICRRTQEAFSYHQANIASWVPQATTQRRTMLRPKENTWPPSLPILSRWRNSACDCLDILHWHVNSISAKAGGWEPPATFHLHLSRLILLSPTEALQSLTAASLAPQHPQNDLHVVAAKKLHSTVLRWAIEDRFKARLAVIHAGALFWHVRRYAVNSFLEPFGIFLSTLVLWAYSTSVHFFEELQTRETGQHGEGQAIPGSTVGSSKSVPITRNEVSEHSTRYEEDSMPLFFYIDRPCDDEIVQAFVTQGEKMSGHLTHIGSICHSGAPKKILEQGGQLLCQHTTARAADSEDSDHRPFVWGIAASFLEALHGLIKGMSN